jgi:hypothetical protein
MITRDGSMTSLCPVLVFAKAPLPGLAKTRLSPALSPYGAARLAQRMLHATLEQVRAAALGPVELCCAPDTNCTAFVEAERLHGVRLVSQGDGDLGERMARALHRTLNGYRRALIVGTDAPTLDAAYLRQAAAELLEHDAVFGPAEDGGYVLVGMRRPLHRAFEGIAWSTPRVMAQTRERLRELGVAHAELATLADIDEPADLQHVPAGWLD